MKVNSQLYMNVNLAKRNLLSILQNNTAWVYTINGNGTEFDCLKNITGALSDPGCETKNLAAGYPFIIRNDSDAVYYDPIGSPTAGFDNNGEVCNTFDATNGNPGCPYRASVRWRPLCDLGPGIKCHQPAIEIFGEIQIKRNATVFNMQKTNYSFQIVRPFVNCPNQAPDFKTTSAQWIEVPDPSNLIINGTFLTTTSLTAPPTSAYVYQTPLFSCDNQIFNFRQRMNILSGYNTEDADNVSSVCLSDPNDSNACLFEWRHQQATWSLWQKDLGTGVMIKLYDKPVGSKPKFDQTTVFSIHSKKGLVQFYIDAELYYVFSAVWPRNYSFKVVPPPANYSLGIETF